MADITTSNISAALKDYYLEGLRVQINEESDPLWAEMRKTSEMVSGDNIVASLRYGRVGGMAALAETATLPTPNPRKSLKVTFDTKNIYGRGRIYEKAIRVGQTSRGSFTNTLETALEDLMTDAKDYVEWQVHGNGTGNITAVSADWASATSGTVSTVVGLAEGMLVDLVNGSTNAVITSGVEVTDVDEDSLTVTVGTAISATASRNDYFTRVGSYNLEMTGLTAIVGTTDNTVWGTNRSTYSWFNPTRVNVNGEISEVKIQEGLDKGKTRTGVDHDFLISNHAIRRSWMNLMVAFRQTVNNVELKGGYSAPVFMNNGKQLPWVTSKYGKAQRLQAISRKNFMVPWLGDWDWFDRDGAILSRTADKAAYEFTLQLYADIFCDVPRGQVDFYGITEH